MYCPRCGSQNTETTKFCRQCGLPLQQITGYVASGGTGPLTQPPAPPAQGLVQLPETAEMLALKHKRILTILSICIAPIIFAILADRLLGLDDVAGIPFILVPLGIVWTVLRYKTKLRQLQEQQLQQYYAQQQHYQQPPPAAFQPPSYQPPLPAPPTNPLATPARGSVTEDETRRL